MTSSRAANGVKKFIAYSLYDELATSDVESLIIFQTTMSQLGNYIKERHGQEVLDSIMRYLLNPIQQEHLKQKILISNNRERRSLNQTV